MRADRRRVLAGGLAALLARSADAAAVPPQGWVVPRLPPPPLALSLATGERRPLARILAGKVTAVQLMFAGCSTSCPPQGMLFAGLAPRLSGPDQQLLSVSVDALGDTPEALAAWMARFGAHAAWQAGVPGPMEVERLSLHLKGVPGGLPASHTAQVFIIDRQARLAWRSADLPSPELILARMAEMA